MTADKIMSPKEWREKRIEEENIINTAPFGLFDAKSMEDYAKYHTHSVIEKAVRKYCDKLNVIEAQFPSEADYNMMRRKAVNQVHLDIISEMGVVNLS